MATRREAAYMGRSHGRCRFPARDQVRQQQNVIPLLMVRRSRSNGSASARPNKSGRRVQFDITRVPPRADPRCPNPNRVLGDIQNDRVYLHVEGFPSCDSFHDPLYGTSMPGEGIVHQNRNRFLRCNNQADD
jgi:hypothetical protein